ncbi:unnamed protein product [Parascedosporium putredinis]|uniref:Asparaginase n=1 Tax=Parascedosporium putredinis TaxID=1442378 RepID=A0A9P1H2B4_9PEZI|nr:unnamed protein product [Parascedosporium putredinis]CAI7994773.1 unnamed protein product [Parascedosporium putredinis]
MHPLPVLVPLLPTALALPSPGLPFVINTWGGPFTVATDAAYASLLLPDASALDAVEVGCSACERDRCDGTVGYGGSPDEACETTLDAMIMDGASMKVGAVAGMRRVKNAIGVARRVLEYTRHTMLAGDLATRFAVENGFEEVDLATEESIRACEEWKKSGCPGNFRVHVKPDPSTSCGPYEPIPLAWGSLETTGFLAASRASKTSHDTISMIAIDARGALAAGTSTNGAAHKVPGRVGDGPIAGSGSYVDAEVGGCGATGDGDVMMRFLPCYQALENLRNGMSPTEAAENAVSRMLRRHPDLQSGIVVVDNQGRHGAAASGWTFTYAFRGGEMNATQVVTVQPVKAALVKQF